MKPRGKTHARCGLIAKNVGGGGGAPPPPPGQIGLKDCFRGYDQKYHAFCSL